MLDQNKRPGLRRAITTATVLLVSIAFGANLAAAYPGGTPDFQTDVAPYCAACHSSTSEDDLSGLGDRAQSELALNKHFNAT